MGLLRVVTTCVQLVYLVVKLSDSHLFLRYGFWWFHIFGVRRKRFGWSDINKLGSILIYSTTVTNLAIELVIPKTLNNKTYTVHRST